MDAVDLRERLSQARTQCGVDGVHRAVAFGRVDEPFVAHPHLHGGLGGEPAVRVLVGDDSHRFDAELVLCPAGGTAHQQLERRIRGLEVVTLVLETLQIVDHLVHGGPVHGQTKFLGLHLDGGTTRHLADHETRSVADDLGIHMFVGVLRALDGRHVKTGLVCERGCAHVRSLRVQRTVQHLGNVVADGGETRQVTLWQAAEAHLQLEIRDDGGEVRVACALPQTVQGSLHLAHARTHGRHGVGHCAAGVVVAVDAENGIVAHH